MAVHARQSPQAAPRLWSRFQVRRAPARNNQRGIGAAYTGGHRMAIPGRRWSVAAALALGVHFLAVGAARAEEDHLIGFKIKDLNAVPGLAGVAVTADFGNETCDLKRPEFMLVKSEKSGGDDPRGGTAGNFVCYKARCTGAVPPTVTTDSQFGVHAIESKKAKLVCLPLNQCGDGDVDPGEECDG